MEIKLKTPEGLVDPIIEIVDGIIIVTPREALWEPKEGDVVLVNRLDPCVGIVRNMYSYGKLDTDRLHFSVGYWPNSDSLSIEPFCACNRNTEPNYRPATEEEKKKLFDKLAEAGYEWDAEKKEIVKLKWTPKVKEDYYTPSWDGYVFEPHLYGWSEDEFDFKCHSMGRVFKTKEECQAFCNKLNEAINSVNP